MAENVLAKIPVITQAILKAQPLTFHSQKLDELDVLQLLAEKMQATIEIKNDIGEAQVRIYRDAGQRFPEEFPRGGASPSLPFLSDFTYQYKQLRYKSL